MATWLLLKSRFPIALAREIARVDAPDLETAISRLGLLSGIGATNIARSPKDAVRAGYGYWVQSEASALLGPDSAKKKKPAAMRARRFTR